LLLLAVYSQVDTPELDVAVMDQLRDGGIDLITLTSSNIARALIRALDEPTRERIRAGAIRLVTISSVTSAAVREFGLLVAAESREETTKGIVEALIEIATKKRT
jgi:uroporphyrinogen III methyltransferase / synthase